MLMAEVVALWGTYSHLQSAVPQLPPCHPCPAAGASFMCPEGVSFEAQEVRAFGLLLRDMVARLDKSLSPGDRGPLASLLQTVVSQCLLEDCRQRPSFQRIQKQLHLM